MPIQLKKWQISNNDQCNVCNVLCDVNHLLITCKLATHSWELMSKTLKIDKTVEEIIFGVNQSTINNFIISTIS